MSDFFAQGLFAPALVLALLAWLVPKLLSFVLPEGVKPLLVNAFLSTIILGCLSGAFFVFLYLYQGLSVEVIAAFGVIENVSFFGRLALISAIIWAPIMILSVANLPRHWVKETW